jgi:hypothetical protein
VGERKRYKGALATTLHAFDRMCINTHLGSFVMRIYFDIVTIAVDSGVPSDETVYIDRGGT